MSEKLISEVEVLKSDFELLASWFFTKKATINIYILYHFSCMFASIVK